MPVPQHGKDFSQYVADCTASLDPYEEPDPHEADRAKIQAWLEYVDTELDRNRSPFIAAEIILKELPHVTKHVQQPLSVFLASAVPIFQRCLPHLTEDFRDVVSSAVHELMPAIYFTRTTERVDGGGEITTKISYAACFWRVYGIYLKHKKSVEVDNRRMATETSVMDRMVLALDRLWVKMCFLSWRTYCRSIREKTLIFRKLTHRVLVEHIAPRFIRDWRKYAHRVVLQAKLARHNALTKELEDLYPQEQQAKSLFEHAQGMLRERIRLVEEAKVAAGPMQIRLRTLEGLLAETKESLRDHWHTWQSCMRELFEDSNPLDDSIEENITHMATYVQSITDTSSLYAMRAKFRGENLGIQQVERCLRSKGLLTITPRATKELTVRTAFTYVPPPDEQPSLTDTVWSLAQACYPVVSPLRTLDIHHCNEDHINVVLRFMATMFSGGHCSLFVPSRQPPVPYGDPTAVGSSSPNGTCHEGTENDLSSRADDGALRETEAPPQRNIGLHMISDVADGLRIFSQCNQSTDRYMMSLRQCLETSEVSIIRSYLGSFFDTWSCLGLPLHREKIEFVTRSFFKETDYPVLEALYPSNGISTFFELVQYLTMVSEYSRVSLISVAEKLQMHYPFDGRDSILFALASDEVRQLCRDHSEHIARLFEHVRVPQEPALSEILTKQLLQKALQLSPEQVANIWLDTGTDAPSVGKDDIEELLYVAAHYYNPSPFSTAVEKLSDTLDACVRYLVNL